MKRILTVLLVLSLLAAPALADPIALLGDYSEEIVEPYDEDDPSCGVFTYIYHIPHVDEDAKGGAGINAFYEYYIDNDLDYDIQRNLDVFEGSDSTTVITYTVTCNSDDYFSVLLRKEEDNPDLTRVIWTGNVFIRANGDTGRTSTLPQLLGLLSATENEEVVENYQTRKTNDLVRDMVWDMIEESREESGFSGDFTRETLSRVFFPDEEYYLDENGDPVFYLQPDEVYDEVPEGADLIRFPIPLEDLLDEL